MKRKEELQRLSEMTVDELREEADRLKESLFRLNFRHALSDTSAINDLRREKKTLARINTYLKQRETVVIQQSA